MTLLYITLLYITIPYSLLINFTFDLLFTALNYVTLLYITLVYTLLIYITLICTTLIYITLIYMSLFYITLIYITLIYITTLPDSPTNYMITSGVSIVSHSATAPLSSPLLIEAASTFPPCMGPCLTAFLYFPVTSSKDADSERARTQRVTNLLQLEVIQCDPINTSAAFEFTSEFNRNRLNRSPLSR